MIIQKGSTISCNVLASLFKNIILKDKPVFYNNEKIGTICDVGTVINGEGLALIHINVDKFFKVDGIEDTCFSVGIS